MVRLRKKIFVLSLVLIGALATVSAFADEASNGEGFRGAYSEKSAQDEDKVWGGEDHPAEEEGGELVDRPQGNRPDPELASSGF